LPVGVLQGDARLKNLEFFRNAERCMGKMN